MAANNCTYLIALVLEYGIWIAKSKELPLFKNHSAAVGFWGLAGVAFENAVEIGQVVEPGFKADFRNRAVAFQQQLTGATDAELGNKLYEGFLGGIFEKTAKRFFRHIGNKGYFAQCYGLFVVLQQILTYQLNTF